ncbi:MAG: hypothetical protein Q4A62_09775 [Eikenella sp.]|nr:hypothetical protein [Eikenella sp.]
MSPNQKKALAVGVLLLVFAAAKLLALQWFTNQQPAAGQTAAPCVPEQGCTLPDGSRLHFAARLKGPFDIELRQVPNGVEKVSVSFSMRDMDMGFNRYDLRPQPDGSWRAEAVRLPLCTDRRRDYLADITVGRQVFQVAFEAR